MKKWGTKIAVNFLVRGIVSFAIIFFVNGFLDGQGISACVGMNPVTFLTSGILGFPGVAIWEKFHILTEYMVKVADYQEEECVRLAFLLHKETMEDNYSLEKLIAACEEKKKEETKIPDIRDIRKETMIDELLEERREKTSYYDTREHDWISEQEMGSSIMRETDNLWMPVKRFLNKHKKSKWGDWDGLHIEEEEL